MDDDDVDTGARTAPGLPAPAKPTAGDDRVRAAWVDPEADEQMREGEGESGETVPSASTGPGVGGLPVLPR